MSGSRVAGIVLLGLGVVLLVIAYNATNAPVERVSNSLLGRYTDETMWYLVGGAIAGLTGLALAFFGRRA